ncbi:kinetochore scaffold 1 isoform X2 [Dipodomys spectabilis]|uniref:kinetochore scaffold 1 isoform X2 n=1 Tax=Dipodomys spectabilis TaxID=105255 RepID=UPI001C53EA1F|nr:kinetochore scaffold 1 isoform X2 [Dipodomys spectabilis]
MDGVSSVATEERDNMERSVRRRHSSILKPPRSPLQDIRSGNEIVQESNTLRNRKSSRRVSFADTIKVFQTECPMKTVRKSEIADTEAGENVPLIQNTNSDDKYCEITGMNTLLCAPIQTQMQQRQFSIIEPNYDNKHGNDQTITFSNENQMDLTASHTVMITKGLLDCTKSQNSTKIDTASFLANIKCHNENLRMKKELKIPMDQHPTPEKKINCNDLIQRLKTRKSSAYLTGPDKENFEIPIYSKQSSSASSTYQMQAFLNVNENSSNITRIFREQDDGMNFTQCLTTDIHIPPSGEDNLVEFKGDITTYDNDCMDLTANHTLQVLPLANNLSKTENQTCKISKAVEAVGGTEAPEKTTVSKSKQNAALQDPFLNPEHRTHCSYIIESETPTVTGTSNQDARATAGNSESVCFSPAAHGYKTLFYSSCDDAMDLTKCLSSMREEKSLLKPDGNFSKGHSNPDSSPVLTEKTFYSGEDSMDITKSHTVAIDNQLFKQDQTNVPIVSAPLSEEAMILQNHVTVAEGGERNVNCHSLPQVSRARLQQSLTNSLSLHSTDKKTHLLEDEDMDLTQSHTSNLSQAPLAPYILASENITKSYSCSKSPPDKWGKMFKNHIKPSQQPKLIPENILTDTQGKEKHQILKVSPYLDNDFFMSANNVAYSDIGLDKQVALRNNGNTVSREPSLFSTRKSFLSSDCPSGQSALKNNTDVNSHIAKSVPGQSSKVPESLRRDLDDPAQVSSHDQVIICSEEEQTMDLTKSHAVVIKFGPSEVQDLNKNNLEQSTIQVKTVNRPIAVKGENCGKSPMEKTGKFVPNNVFGVLEDKSIQKPEFLMEKQNAKVCGRKSVSGLKMDKTVIFSDGDENDMEITKSCTVDINHRSLLDKGDANRMPVEGTSKTILYACEQGEMEITTSYTVALECERVSSNERIIRPVEKTTMFVDNHDDLKVTKSHAVFIDCQATEKTLPEYPTFGIAREGNSTEDNSCIQEITKKQALSVGSEIVFHPAQKHQMTTLIPPNTLCRDQSKVELIKFHRTDTNEVVMGKVADQAYIVKGAQAESCRIDSTDRKNVDFTSSHGVVICGSSDNWKQSLKNLHGKTEGVSDLQTVQLPPTPEQVLELGNTGFNNKSVLQTKEINNIVSNDASDNKDEENKNSHSGSESMSIPLNTAGKDKMRRYSLGIFLPRLPNKRNGSVTGIDETEQIPADSTDLNHLEILPVSNKDLGTGSVVPKMNLSPSQYINEENLPGEINSSGSISTETEENILIETDQKATDNKMEETCISHKRTWVQEGDAVSTEKKIRKHDFQLGDTIQGHEIFDPNTEEDIDKHVNSVLAKSPSRTPSSCSSSLDSVKADGTSLDFSTNRNSQMESQFLSDTICEENLREKLKDGSITIREFFILLQVHIVIQKPRQSNLPAKFTTDISPTPEDLMLRQYVYGPKIQIYREDCEVLRQKIEALKISALNQDKLLTDVNRNLWEKMRNCSDEELKAFGIYLNKIKSRSTKMTKVFTHQGKVALYNKLVQSAQNEREKLQIRINEMDNILKKISNCLAEVEIETKDLENEEKDNPVDEWNSQMKAAENELKQLKSEEEELERKVLEVEVQKKQTLAQIDFMQKQINRTEELLDQLSLSEWNIIEWNDTQAVFTFVYDTIQLTITFGEPVAGIPFLDQANRKIVEVDFQSLLDEDKAPPSSLLVHKLIFQYIEEQESWKKKCITQHQIPQMLHELSLVVNHCRLLGEEIEFLKRWGPNYNLMYIDVKHSELKLLFSSSVAFAKFELTLSVSAYYPLVPLPFTVQNHLGNIGHDEIATIMSKVPLEDNYLKNIVKQIYQDLLQDCHFSC